MQISLLILLCNNVLIAKTSHRVGSAVVQGAITTFCKRNEIIIMLRWKKTNVHAMSARGAGDEPHVPTPSPFQYFELKTRTTITLHRYHFTSNQVQ